MNEALDFIFNATNSGEGTEIFIPKLRSYSIRDLKDAITELFSDTGEQIIGIRQGEKLHETLINFDEMRNAWEYKNMYMISEHLSKDHIQKTYSDIKKIEEMDTYSSDKAEKISKNELKQMIQNSIY